MLKKRTFPVNPEATNLMQWAQNWLRQDVFPLWIRQGIDAASGGFVESLSFQGEPREIPRRAMVQARQIFSVLCGARLQCLDPQTAHRIAVRAMGFFERSYLLESGACRHAVLPDGTPQNEAKELYTQAFALFALAQVYAVTKEATLKQRALRLVGYLRENRRAPRGGYTEIKEGRTLFQSNPHMHLFEAALAWLEADRDEKTWRELASELRSLCFSRFIQPETGALAEHFTAEWSPEKHDGLYVLEPGHHFEWAWLLAVHQELTGEDSGKIRHRLRDIGENHGVDAKTQLTYDEIWSDFSPKRKSSRFWPHCERVKAAVKLGLEVPAGDQKKFAQNADDGMRFLKNYLKTPVPGLWRDAILEDGGFNDQEPKASSLYHLINAIEEYVKLRPKLKDE